MHTHERTRRILVTALVLVLALGAGTGCSVYNRIKESAGNLTREEPPPSPVYYDFGDVLVPAELDVSKKDSFVYQTAGFSAGVLVLSGRVDADSVVSFFEGNMIKDNWMLLSVFKSPRTMMLFRKQNRWCVINITDGTMSTDVEIWVAPTVGMGPAEMGAEPGLVESPLSE